MKVLAISRARRFSPNSVEKDKAILEAVAIKLRQRGYEVAMADEERLPAADLHAHSILTMARLPETLRWLKSQDALIINSPQSVEKCSRCQLEETMRRISIPMAASTGTDGYWLKRGDGSAQTKDDVVYACDEKELGQKIQEMRDRGISQYVVSAHVKGDLVKFYGVGCHSFFRYYYPTDDGESKFGDEARNGLARHFAFDVAELRREVERLAAAIGIDVYGGDCIVREDGSFCIIDFNDWPSFSRCREEAAGAIVNLFMQRMINR